MTLENGQNAQNSSACSVSGFRSCHTFDNQCCLLFTCRLFRAVSKPRPSDHPLLILFVLGGVTNTEVRQIRDVVSAAKSSIQVSMTLQLIVQLNHGENDVVIF